MRLCSFEQSLIIPILRKRHIAFTLERNNILNMRHFLDEGFSNCIIQ